MQKLLLNLSAPRQNGAGRLSFVSELTSLRFFSVLLAVFRGADPLHPMEGLGEVAQRGEAQNFGNQGQGVVGLSQEEAALLHPAGDLNGNGDLSTAM